MKPHITANAQKVLDEIIKGEEQGHLGLTAYEVGVRIGMKPQSVSARINELHTNDKVADFGNRRPTDSGRKAIVWRPC